MSNRRTVVDQVTASRRTVLRGAAVLGAAGALAAVAPVLAPGAAAAKPATGRRGDFPDTINLPDGFQPEGIAIGARPLAYLGSLADGSIYRADLATGAGEIISVGPGTPSVGLKIDRQGRLFVAGGPAGVGRVVSAATGQVLATYQFASGTTFVNDVVVTGGSAWFTDSFSPALYRVPLGRRGALPGQGQVVSVPLGGDIVFTDGFNVNGIVPTPDGRALIVAQSNAGALFRVDPATGEGRAIDLGGAVVNGDGLLLCGRTLYAVSNGTLVVLTIDWAATQARVVRTITDPRFDVPTTVAAFGDRLYLPNARFTTPPEPTTPYTVVGVRAR